MAQVPFGTCVSEFLPRSSLPETVPPFVGPLAQLPSDDGRLPCMPVPEALSRPNGWRPGMSVGTPTLPSGQLDVWGFPETPRNGVQQAETQNGFIYIERADPSDPWNPTTKFLDALHRVPASRKQQLPDRYFSY